jgi:hypothetical protein
MSKVSNIALAMSILAFAACSDDPSEPVAGYDVEVRGDVTERLRGQAWFGSDTGENGEPIFGVILGAVTDDHVVVLGKDGSAAPAVGEYTIREPGTGGAGWDAIYIIGDDELDAFFVADSGRVAITESKSGRLKGSVKLYASGLIGENETGFAEVVIEGTFDAKPAPGMTAARTPQAGKSAFIR